MSTCIAATLDVVLLGCGTVGSALARLAAQDRSSSLPLNISGALVRDPLRARALPSSKISADARALLASDPHVIVELLGGTEPARGLLLEGLARRIPVVTANKTLLARHGAELRHASAAARTPLLYEAAVIAGVPFLGTFARRAQAASVSGLLGIVNGTSNYVLTRGAAEGCDLVDALAEAQRHGYAEPDPHNDVAGVDAAEKLAVLLQHFASLDIHPDIIETEGIGYITSAHIDQARQLDGVIKPVVMADWSRSVDAFAGPAFVPADHVLARVDGVENALLVNGRHGRLLFQGPGAGPDVTAATVLDDVREIAAGVAPLPQADLRRTRPSEPMTSWLVSLDDVRLPRFADIADLFASFGIYTQRVTGRTSRDGRDYQSAIVFPVERSRLAEGLRALRNATGCSTSTVRALDAAA
jgi:homoserine dehydrogenase